MKSLLIIASFIALAVASPTHRGIEAGPAISDFEPIAVDPAIADVDPFDVSPSNVAVEVNEGSGTSLVQIIVNIDGTTSVVNAPINVYRGARALVAESDQVDEAAAESVQVIETGPAISDFKPVAVEPFAGSPTHVAVKVTDGSGISLTQIIVNIDGTTTVVNAPINGVATGAIVAEPVQVVEAAPEPVQVIEVAPEPVQVVEGAPAPIGNPVLPMPVDTEVIPEPIAIGTPQLPIPVVVLPELN